MNVSPFSFRELGVDAIITKTPIIKSFVAAGKRGEAEAAPAQDLPPPPPSFTEADLKNAEGEGFRRGFLEGSKDGQAQAQSEQAQVEEKLSGTVEEFIHDIAPLFEDYRKLATELREQMPRIAFAIAQKVAGNALAENAKQVVETMAERMCESMIQEPKLTVTVHQSLASSLQTRLSAMAATHRDAAQITVKGSAEMPVADCRVEWNHGSLERKTDLLWSQVEKIANDMGLTAKRDADEHMQAIQEKLPTPKKPRKKAQAVAAEQTDTITEPTPDTTKEE